MTEKNHKSKIQIEYIEETRNYFIKEKDQNEFMSNKNKKAGTTLSYIEHFFTLAFTVIRCVSISAFASLVNIPTEIMSSATRLDICTITAGVKIISQ